MVQDALPSTVESRVAVGGRSMHVGIDEVWSALGTDEHWIVDKAADVWQVFEEKDPCLADTVKLSIVAEKFESLPGISCHYLVNVFLGNDELGRTCFSSDKHADWPPKTYPQLNFSGNNFMLKLIPMKINALGRRLLSTLMGMIPGTQEANLTTKEFHLCGQLGKKNITGCLELRLSWFQDGVLQYILVPFIPASPNFNVLRPLSEHSYPNRVNNHV